MTLWAKIVATGSNPPSIDTNSKRCIKLTNSVSLFCFLLCSILFLAYTTLVTWNLISITIPLVGIGCLLTLFINYMGYTKLARLWICFVIPVSCLVISIISKMYEPEVQDSEYYEFRAIILCASIFPYLLFSFDNKKLLTTALSFSLACLLLFDPIHNLLGVGYFQTGQHDRTYYFSNIVFLISYAGLMGTINFLKGAFEQSEERNMNLIADLNKTKNSLETTNNAIAKQNKEILLQSRILKDSQKNLSQAYDLIEQQRDLLSQQNKSLELELISKRQELTATNSELIKHNTELSQFSYTISHNLRGPLASLLGLLDIIDRIKFSPDDVVIIDHLKKAVWQMESTIKDLIKIVDVRDNVFRIRQHFTLKGEIQRAFDLVKEKIDVSQVTIHEDLGIQHVYSVRPMLQSILYNLLSNSIKFRSPERSPEITIQSTDNSHYYIIKITDNGLGIDLKTYGKDLFKLYKRFHFHTEGKGLGLYMVKLQCELLGGTVDVMSELNKFTTFTIYLKKPQNVNQKLLHVGESARIFYDGMINSTGVIWNCSPDSKEYREIFEKCIQQLMIYNTPSWISDISRMGNISQTDQQWLLKEIIPVAKNNGLKRIAIIQSNPANAQLNAYVSNIIPKFAIMHIEVLAFSCFEDAVSWIQQENERSDAQNFQLAK